jgi:hypothetical protein
LDFKKYQVSDFLVFSKDYIVIIHAIDCENMGDFIIPKTDFGEIEQGFTGQRQIGQNLCFWGENMAELLLNRCGM